MRYLIGLLLLFLGGRVWAQPVSVYDCQAGFTVTQADIDNDDDFRAGCILFEEPTTYTFGQSDSKTVTGSERIDVEPGFTAEDFTSGNGMTLQLCDDLKDVMCFSHADLSNVKALKKFEFGIELPADIEQRIRDYVVLGIDTLDEVNGGINPYLEWHLDATAILFHRASGFTKELDGFYFQDYKRREAPMSDTNAWSWTPLTAQTHHMRFRYSYPEEGVWDVSIRVKLKNGSTFTYCPFSVNVVSNTEDDGYVEVASNKRVLQRNGELFFPVGQNIPWAFDEAGYVGHNSGAYGENPTRLYPFIEMEEQINELHQSGVNYFRFLMAPTSSEIEFEKVGDYSKRLMYAWEIDYTLDQADSLDMYIHFNLLLHFRFQRYSGGYRLAWDWGEEDLFGEYGNLEDGHYGYRSAFNLDQTQPRLFFSDPNCIKYYKQRLRYIIARYGYSTHIAMFELLSESDNACSDYTPVHLPGNTVPVAFNNEEHLYDNDPSYRLELAWWHDIMAKYIKNELGHKEHLISVDYAYGTTSPDYSYSIPEVDVIAWNQYNGGVTKHQITNKAVDSVFQLGINPLLEKPIFFSECGPTSEECDEGTTYRKDAWMYALSGVAGMNIWSHKHPQWYPYIGNVNRFMNETPEIEKLLLQNSWWPDYSNDEDQYNDVWLPAYQKEAIYVSGIYNDPDDGLDKWLSFGAVSNLTDNFYTNTDLGVSSYCSSNPPGDVDLQSKSDLGFLNQSIQLDVPQTIQYNAVFYDQNGDFFDNENTPLTPGNVFVHPLSCVNICDPYLGEIPFLLKGDLVNKAYVDDSDYDLSELKSRLNVPSETTTEESFDSVFYVYPNPANDRINVVFSNQKISRLEICTVDGRLLQLFQPESSTVEMNITNYESGVFVILGKDTSGIIIDQKVWIKL